MMRLFGTVTTLVFTLSFASGVMACDKHKAAAEKSAAVEAVANAKSGGSLKAGDTVVEQGVARVMKQMPQMTYKVGDFETPCAYTAASKAKDAGSPIAYLVGGKSFESKNDAMNQQASLMRAELANAAVVAPSVEGECIKCPVTASALAAKKNVKVKHMVAGIEFDSDKEARTVADKLAAKMKQFASTASSPGSSPCSKKASGCSKGAKSAKTAQTASATKGCCKSGKSGGAKTAADTASSSKSATVASAAGPKGCCGKAKKTSEKGAKVASAKAGTPTSTLKLGCCAKKGAKTSTAPKQVVKTETQAVSDDTPELARAKQMVRDIVEFVAAAKESKTS